MPDPTSHPRYRTEKASVRVRLFVQRRQSDVAGPDSNSNRSDAIVRVMGTLEQALDRARTAFAARSWLEAYGALAAADDEELLAPEDLELRATAARMLVRDDEAVELLERAHHAYLERGDAVRAAYCAGWIGMTLFYNGAVGPAGGWIARANRLLEDVPQETAVHGYVMLPGVFRNAAAGDLE